MNAITITSNTGNVKATDSIFDTLVMEKRWHGITTEFYFTVNELEETFEGELDRKQIISTLHYLKKVTSIKKENGHWSI